jgi:uncharacterized protein YxeA
MKKVVIILSLVLIVLGLHCYALHKRVAYYENEVIQLNQEKVEFHKAVNAWADATIKTLNEMKGGK